MIKNGLGINKKYVNNTILTTKKPWPVLASSSKTFVVLDKIEWYKQSQTLLSLVSLNLLLSCLKMITWEKFQESPGEFPGRHLKKCVPISGPVCTPDQCGYLTSFSHKEASFLFQNSQ
jgi:hypothetical protein